MTVNLPEGTHLAYVVNHEAWYAEHIPLNDPPTIMVQASAQGGGVSWEFSVEDGTKRIGKPSLLLTMWDDSWGALPQIPELFAALAAGHAATLGDLRELLDSLGAVDETSRVSPYEPGPAPEPEAVSCPGIGCRGRAWKMPGGAVFCEATNGVVAGVAR